MPFPRSDHTPTRLYRWTIRTGHALILGGLVGLIHGTIWAASRPAWPQPAAWVVMAAVAAVVQLAPLAAPTDANSGAAAYLAGMVAFVRGVGYLVAPPHRFNGAAVGAYAIVAGVVLIHLHLQDKHRSRHHDRRGAWVPPAGPHDRDASLAAFALFVSAAAGSGASAADIIRFLASGSSYGLAVIVGWSSWKLWIYLRNENRVESASYNRRLDRLRRNLTKMTQHAADVSRLVPPDVEVPDWPDLEPEWGTEDPT